jgi:hypothetical protein
MACPAGAAAGVGAPGGPAGSQLARDYVKSIIRVYSAARGGSRDTPALAAPGFEDEGLCVHIGLWDEGIE